MSQRAVFVLITVMALCATWARARSTPAAPEQIDALIKQLGSDCWAVREDATQRLIQIGFPAMEAVRRAILIDDLETAGRAKLIVNSIVMELPHQLAELRKAEQESIAEGNYTRAMEIGQGLATAGEGVEALDWLWYGHACQLAGHWKEAVDAYQHVQEEKAFSGRGRMSLAIWIARIQVGELKDAKSAAAGLAKVAAEFADVEDRDRHLLTRILSDLAAAQAAAGDATAALATWSRLRDCVWNDPNRGGQVVLDAQRVAETFLSIPADQPLPDAPCLYVLKPDSPSTTLMLSEEATQRRAYFLSAGPGSPDWKFAFVSVPGQELERMEFDCDVEQLNTHSGGQFQCFVVAGGPNPGTIPLASLSWKKKPGREICHLEATIPPGIKVVHIETGTWKDNFIVHSVQVKATFRPMTTNPPTLQPRAWIQTAALPPGGKITYGDQTIGVDWARNNFKPGRYTFAYEVPGRSERFQVQADIRPGGRYGFFANLDSPFHWTQTELGGSLADVNVVTLEGGRHLAIGCRQGAIVLSQSSDCLTWTPPTPAPFSGVFENIHPAALATRDGTVQLAFFSNRLSLQYATTAGYRLFLTSTRDGNVWTTPRPVAIGVVSGWPLTAPALLQRENGDCLVLWRSFAASAKSFQEIQALEPFTVEEGELKNANYFHPQLTADSTGRVHLVFSNFGAGLCHMTSATGTSWTAPRLLAPSKPLQDVSDPQLIWAKGRTLLLYSDSRGAYLAAVDLAAGTIDSEKAIMITNHVIPLCGARATVTNDGEVLLPAGGDTSWMLRATMAELLNAVPASTTLAPATRAVSQ